MYVFSICCSICVLLAVGVSFSSGTTLHSYGNNCYDCNFSPTEVPKERGTNHCALQTYLDRQRVDKWGCKSGKCFIRIDENGMVYRGCANEENLPWGVSTSTNCKRQGPKNSLWWFCEGDLCNDGVLGETEDRCGEPQEYQQPSSSHYETESDRSGGYRTSDSSNRRGYQPGHYNFGNEGLLYNPCDGKCEHNPSGLFADTFASDHFIQCGRSTQYGKPCKCCKPHRLKCPYNTEFDDATKVCSKVRY